MPLWVLFHRDESLSAPLFAAFYNVIFASLLQMHGACAPRALAIRPKA